MIPQIYQLQVQDLNKNLNINHTVFPQDMPREEDWFKYNRVSSSYVYPEAVINGKVIMQQYAQDESYFSKLKRVIDKIR